MAQKGREVEGVLLQHYKVYGVLVHFFNDLVGEKKKRTDNGHNESTTVYQCICIKLAHTHTHKNVKAILLQQLKS